MNVVISINKKYVPIAYVMMTSLFKNNGSEAIDLYLLHSELEEEDLYSLRKLADIYGNRLIPLYVDREVFPKDLPTSKLWSIETYYRLVLLKLLPDYMERILYLDVDIIVQDDLRDLYYGDFNGNHFIACDDADPYGKNFPGRKEMFHEAFEEGYRYFNAGVMVWNLSFLRENYTAEDYFELAARYDFKLTAVDQDLLNLMHWGHITYADGRYNYFARIRSNAGDGIEDARKAAVIHYLSEKPWNADGYHYPIEKIWWEYARETPYYEELLEAFLEKTLTDQTIFLHASELNRINNELQANLNESLALNKKLFGMLSEAREYDSGYNRGNKRIQQTFKTTCRRSL